MAADGLAADTTHTNCEMRAFFGLLDPSRATMAQAGMRVQLRSTDAASLRETRARNIARRPRPVAASASNGRNVNINAVQFAKSENSELLIPVGKYCETHYKAVRRPTR